MFPQNLSFNRGEPLNPIITVFQAVSQTERCSVGTTYPPQVSVLCQRLHRKHLHEAAFYPVRNIRCKCVQNQILSNSNPLLVFIFIFLLLLFFYFWGGNFFQNTREKRKIHKRATSDDATTCFHFFWTGPLLLHFSSLDLIRRTFFCFSVFVFLFF